MMDHQEKCHWLAHKSPSLQTTTWSTIWKMADEQNILFKRGFSCPFCQLGSILLFRRNQQTSVALNKVYKSKSTLTKTYLENIFLFYLCTNFSNNPPIVNFPNLIIKFRSADEHEEQETRNFSHWKDCQTTTTLPRMKLSFYCLQSHL